MGDEQAATTLPFPDAEATLVAIAREAGDAILAIYGATDRGIEEKGDGSPLTAADTASNAVIVERLQELAGEIPILSEESKEVPYEERAAWRRFWLVDPLDGTKEFIKRNGEFTVNIALVEDGRPVVGVVHAPVLDKTYVGFADTGARVYHADDAPRAINVPATPEGRSWRVVASRSHQNADTAAFLARLPEHELVSCGSSLKLCKVAAAEADIYPRLGPTMEWDTAAAHAVVAAAGGRVIDVEGQDLRYNKQDLLNPYFIVTGSIDVAPYLAD